MLKGAYSLCFYVFPCEYWMSWSQHHGLATCSPFSYSNSTVKCTNNSANDSKGCTNAFARHTLSQQLLRFCVQTSKKVASKSGEDLHLKCVARMSIFGGTCKVHHFFAGQTFCHVHPVDEDSQHPTTNYPSTSRYPGHKSYKSEILASLSNLTLGQQQLRPFGLQWAISKLHKWLITLGEMCHVRLRLDGVESSQGICPPLNCERLMCFTCWKPAFLEAKKSDHHFHDNPCVLRVFC